MSKKSEARKHVEVILAFGKALQDVFDLRKVEFTEDLAREILVLTEEEKRLVELTKWFTNDEHMREVMLQAVLSGSLKTKKDHVN